MRMNVNPQATSSMIRISVNRARRVSGCLIAASLSGAEARGSSHGVRLQQDVAGRTRPRRSATIEDDDGIGESGHLVAVVRHTEDRDAELVAHALEVGEMRHNPPCASAPSSARRVLAVFAGAPRIGHKWFRKDVDAAINQDVTPRR
jgi:hypothetical protein